MVKKFVSKNDEKWFELKRGKRFLEGGFYFLFFLLFFFFGFSWEYFRGWWVDQRK